MSDDAGAQAFWRAAADALFDPRRIDMGAFELARQMIQPEDEISLNGLKAAVGLAATRPEKRVTKKQLMERYSSAIHSASNLEAEIRTIQRLSLGAAGPKNPKLHETLTDGLRSRMHAVARLRGDLEWLRDFFDRNIPGRYVEGSSTGQMFVYWLVVIWRRNGRKVTTTQNGPFDQFLSHAYQAAYRRELTGSSTLLEQAKAVADMLEAQTPEQLEELLVQVKADDLLRRELQQHAFATKKCSKTKH